MRGALGCGLLLLAGLLPLNAAELRLNQLQLPGTAESTKLAPTPALLSLIRMGGRKDAQALDFAEPPLAAQLDAGAQVLTFDIAYDPKGGLFKNPAGASMAGDLLAADYVAAMGEPGFKVIHVPDIDFNASCLTLKACLAQVTAWHRDHPGHEPLVIVLQAEEDKTPMPGAVKPLPFDEAAIADLTQEIAGDVPRSAILMPAAAKGHHASMGDAARADDWPSATAARGKLLFVLDCERGAAASASPLLFAASHDENAADMGFVVIDDPLKDGARIAAAVKAGLMVITRADADTVEARADDTRRRDAAYASGAQIIRTNFLVPDPKISAYQGVETSQSAKTDKPVKIGPRASVEAQIAAFKTARVP